MARLSRREAATLLVLAALAGAAAVALDALGSHALRERLSGKELGWWQTGCRYLLVHALAGALAALLAMTHCGRGGAAAAWLLGGAAVFAGTLCAMALGAPAWLGRLTPLGGGAMILGWVLLAVAGWRAGAEDTA
ncbi:MAG: hypothetical protein KatS3mg102_2607 [Planctomycetota bacterium]|nr:MAG: hypothetical protein KatS3mg102_2607 [Planctomycetota bacterium]